MTAFLWTMGVLLAIGILVSAYHLAMGSTPEPVSPGGRAVAMLVNIGLLVWAMRLLGLL